MGSPLTMTATVCACSGEPQPIRSSAAAQPRMRGERRFENVAVMIIFAISTDSDWNRTAPGDPCSGSVPAAVLLDPAVAARRRRTGYGPQADLKHKRMTKHGRR